MPEAVEGRDPTLVGDSLSHRRNDYSFGTKQVGMSPDQLPTILLDSFDEALLGGTPCAESCHKRAGLAPQDHYV